MSIESTGLSKDEKRSGGPLDDTYSDSAVAALISKSERSFKRYRAIGVGPETVWIGKTPRTTGTALRTWIERGGTRAARSRGRRHVRV